MWMKRKNNDQISLGLQHFYEQISIAFHCRYSSIFVDTGARVVLYTMNWADLHTNGAIVSDSTGTNKRIEPEQKYVLICHEE